MDSKPLPLKEYLVDPLWKNNQILIAILGICSALGITLKVSTAIAMGASVTFVTAGASLFVSILRRYTPDSVRMITQLALISMFVIIVNEFLKAYFFEISKIMSVYVGLIITNCLVMGRAEAMAKSVPPLPAFLDGMGAGLGYAIVICIVAGVREFFGSGALLGFQLIPDAWYATAANPDGYQNFGLMLLAPAAFFILGGMIWVTNILQGNAE